MYILTIEDSFASAHQLRGYRGKCENIHGHNWKVEVNIQGELLDENGLLIDFHILKDLLKKITGKLDHKNLNDVVPFDKINPSSENIARYISENLNLLLDHHSNQDITVQSVTVWESETSRCTYKA